MPGSQISCLPGDLKIMSLLLMLKFRRTALDLSQFLCCLQIMLKDFDLFWQKDASEIMSFVFKELCGQSPHAQEMLTTILKNQVTCNN